MTKGRKIDLVEGPILKSLILMALPIMGTSFIQMAYNLTDMIWIGFLGTDALTAVGLAGFFVWLATAFITLSKTGTEVRVAQSTGAKDEKRAEVYARNGLQMAFVIALLYTVVLIVFKGALIDFFKTGDATVETMAKDYLVIVALGMVFQFGNQVFTGIFNGRGDSRMPFITNTVGLVINICLDPLLIHVLKMGVVGAAVATVFAQMVVFFIFYYQIKWKHTLYHSFKLWVLLSLKTVKDILRLGFMPSIQNGLFTLISMQIARIIAQFGKLPIGVQKVGAQIESITWMTALGIAVALGAFVGQNYGAKRYDRVLKGYRTALKLALVFGLLNTGLLYLAPKWLFMIFTRDPQAVALGIDYLKILSVSQLFMFIEITVGGAFNGIGMTKPGAFTSIVFNFLRIPMAMVFSQTEIWGLNGVWWSLTFSSILKGVLVWLWLEYTLRSKSEFQKIRS